jgi:hypothetical protein
MVLCRTESYRYHQSSFLAPGIYQNRKNMIGEDEKSGEGVIERNPFL